MQVKKKSTQNDFNQTTISKFKFDLTKDALIKILWFWKFVFFSGASYNFLFLSFFSEGKIWYLVKIIQWPTRDLTALTRSLKIGLKFVQLHVVSRLPLSKMMMQQTIDLFNFKLKLSSLTFCSKAFIDICISFSSSIKQLHNDESYRLPSRYSWHVLTCLQN